jgi:hypothetical protein
MLDHRMTIMAVRRRRRFSVFYLSTNISNADGHAHHGYQEPKTFADYVKPEYWYR